VIREAYSSAADFFVDTVAQIQAPQWQQIGLGVWTVRDLVGHTSRALSTVETYLAKPAARVELERPVDYFLQALATLANPAAVAARGRDAGAALGPDPVATVRDLARRVLAGVQAAQDDTPVGTPVGGMRLIDYLPSRVFELTVHTLDLATALGLSMTVPAAAAAVTLHLTADLAMRPEKTAALLLAATGHRPLPEGFSIL
jgi:uncharacterized protein (TIGR03083 family)